MSRASSWARPIDCSSPGRAGRHSPRTSRPPICWGGCLLAAASARLRPARIYADSAKWADGEYTAELFDAKAKEKAAPLATRSFRVVRQQVGKHWTGDKLAELAVWLRHANRPRDIWKKVPYFRNLDRAIAEPKLLYDGMKGLVLRSYHNPHLERLQPYGVYVPKAYDGEKPMALLILLHGSGGNYLNIVSDVYEGQELETNPMLVANAGAFRNQEYRHMALDDVLWVIEDMRAKYNVDPDRVYVQGISLGGRGAIELAALRPDVFAAACPQGVYGCLQEASDPGMFAAMQPYTRWQIARWDIRSYLANIRHVPMQIIYGHKDRTTPALNALSIKHMVRYRHGGQAEAVGFDAGHNISYPQYKWSDTRAWLLKHRLVKDPNVVSARVATLRFNRYYWVTVDAMERYWQMADVDAKYDRAAGQVTLRLRNVAKVTIAPPGECKSILVDGKTVAMPEGKAPAKVTLVPAGDGVWEIDRPAGAASKPAGPVKRHGQSGPIWDVMHGRCRIAYGTGGSAKEDEQLRKLAESLARLDATWGPRSLPVVTDAEVTAEVRQTCNLLLVGDPRTNRLLGGHDWPFDLDAVAKGKGISVLGQTYRGAGDVLCFVYPSPFAPDRYVYVVTPATPAAALPVALPRPARGASAPGRTGACWATSARNAGCRPRSTQAGTFDADWKLQKIPGPLKQPRPMNWEN